MNDALLPPVPEKEEIEKLKFDTYKFAFPNKKNNYYSNLDKNKPEKLIDFDKKVYNDSNGPIEAPNPSCTEDVCSPSLWVPARGLCLYCNYRRS